MRLSDREEMLARLGSTELRPRDVVSLIYPEIGVADVPQVDRKRAVIGLGEGQHFDRQQCCQPLPGERIVGLAAAGVVLQFMQSIVMFWRYTRTTRIFGSISLAGWKTPRRL